MTAAEFRAWRKRLSMTQSEAAEALGLKPRVVMYYEAGVRDGKPVEIPKYIALAAKAIALGLKE